MLGGSLFFSNNHWKWVLEDFMTLALAFSFSFWKKIIFNIVRQCFKKLQKTISLGFQSACFQIFHTN